MLDALIVDDEQPARKRLVKLLQPMVETDRLRIAGAVGDGVEALDHLQDTPCDVLFLDIQMPELSGFDVLERLSPDDRPEVIFTTAYDEHALRAFEANAVDYLLKPIVQERLEEAVSRVEKIRRTPALQAISDERLQKLLDWIDARPTQDDASPPSYADQVTVSFRDRIRVIPVEQIIAVEINEGITRLFVIETDADDRPVLRQHVVDYTLDHLEDNLDPEIFMRVHRSSIVQVQHIKEMIPWFSGRYKLVLTGDHEVIASRERSKNLKDRLII